MSVLAAWKRESIYTAEDDYVFPSIKFDWQKPRTGTMLVQDYIRPAAIRAGILIEKKSELFSKEGDQLSRFGFHKFGAAQPRQLFDGRTGEPCSRSGDHAPFANGHDALLRALV
ncbi:MAG: hypothetical protein ACRD3P_15660 [Terriglobales bacterium]